MMDFRFFSFLGALVCLVAISPHATAATVKSATELVNLFKSTSGGTISTTIELEADLDFSQITLEMPLNAKSSSACVPYSGVFRGNGHTIKGLVMLNDTYPHAGLFCTLEGATVENLIIDSSCSFTGNSAGALSAFVTGPLTVTNVTNRGLINGTYKAGGLVGDMKNLKQGNVVFFDNCLNEGNVSAVSMYAGGLIGHVGSNDGTTILIRSSTNNGTIRGKWNVGGIIAYFTSNPLIQVNIINCTNNGSVLGDFRVGGFVSYAQTTKDTFFSFENCTNNGIVRGIGPVSGYFGWLNSNSNVSLSMRKCTNNGFVSGNYEVGSMIGYLYDHATTKVNLSHVTNFGFINGSSCVSGFVGYFNTDLPSSLKITNCMNKGTVQAHKGDAHGFFSSNTGSSSEFIAQVFNSINKGTVNSSSYSYGIANTLTNARNVVNTGNISGIDGSYSFWKKSVDAHMIYGLNTECSKCMNNVTLFQHNTINGFYDAIESGEHVHDLLNDETIKQKYGALWTHDLELVDNLKFRVTVNGAFNSFLTWNQVCN